MPTSTPKPSISRRKYIRWPPASASEPTDTLVLTSAQHKLFVDIRVLKNSPPESTSSNDLSKCQLDWAFAGISRPLPAKDKNGVSYARWLHWLDSHSLEQPTGEYALEWQRGEEAMWELAKDRGTMWTSPNGEEVESGEMVNPATGKQAKYEEMWDAVESQNEEGKLACVAMTLEESEEGKPERLGVVVRVGQYIQSATMIDNSFSAERWEKVPQSKQWKRTFCIGSNSAPCEVVRSEPLPEAGKQLASNGAIWKVLESEVYEENSQSASEAEISVPDSLLG